MGGTSRRDPEHCDTRKQRPRTEETKIERAEAYIGKGELSHAARELQAQEIAPGNEATLRELRDPALRPARRSEPLPEALDNFAPSFLVALDKTIFGETLRRCRKGQSGGILGSRYKQFKLCLENEVAFDALFAAAGKLARAEVPQPIVDVMKTSALTALLKPNQRIRGIASGDSFRRLVSKSLARQYQQELRAAVYPHNVGMCDRSGTDTAIHAIRYLTDRYPDKVVISIDGVGAFDHVSRARMFEHLLSDPKLSSLVPFVRQWYGEDTQYRWIDDTGACHIIRQADGGEQGDSLMPALFCLGFHPALEELHAELPVGAVLIAYLDDAYIVCNHSEVVDCVVLATNIFRLVSHIDVHLGKLAAWSRNICPPPERFVGL